MEVDLRAVESAVAFIDDIVKSHVVQGAAKTFCRHLPVLVASHAVLRTGGQFYMIFKSKQAVDFIDQLGHTLDLIPDLLRRHKDMGVVLSEAADTHKPVELTGFLMPVYQSQLSHPDRQILVGAGL